MNTFDFNFDDWNWGSWGVGDFYDGNEKKLRDAIDSGKPFDTDWHGFKKELQSMRIQRTESKVIVSVSEYMDDLEDYALILDCLTDEEEQKITEEQLEEIRNQLYYLCWSEFTTETSEEEELPVNATFEQIMDKAVELIDACGRQLETSFHNCIGVTLSVLYDGMESSELMNLIDERIEKIG